MWALLMHGVEADLIGVSMEAPFAEPFLIKDDFSLGHCTQTIWLERHDLEDKLGRVLIATDVLIALEDKLVSGGGVDSVDNDVSV